MRSSSGARKAELRRLEVVDINVQKREVYLFGKGARERLVPIRGEVVRAFRRFLETPLPILERLPEPDDRIFFPYGTDGRRLLWIDPKCSRARDRMLSPRGMHEWWVKTLRDAGVRHRKLHYTRHTYATDVLNATEGNIYAAKELLGHSSTRVTEVYLHSSGRHKAIAVEALRVYREADRDQVEEPVEP